MSNTSISIQEPAPPARATRWSLSETNPAERYRSAFPSILSDSVPGENASAPLIGDRPLCHGPPGRRYGQHDGDGNRAVPRPQLASEYNGGWQLLSVRLPLGRLLVHDD